MLVYYILVFSSLLHTSTSVPPKGEKFKWIAKAWPQKIPNAPPNVPIIKPTYAQDILRISCETNDPDARVTLKQKRGYSDIFRNTVEMGKGRIMQMGQSFVVRSVKMSDFGYYACAAVDKEGRQLPDLKKGRLLVRPRIPSPQIIPEDSVSFETWEDGVIRCKIKALEGIASTSLTWYRKLPSGRKVKMDVSRVSSERERRWDNTWIDTEKLFFKNFTSSEVGEYICEYKPRAFIARYSSVKVMKESDVAPEVTINIQPPKPKENSQLKLTCTSSGSPKPQTTWERNGKEIKTCRPSRRSVSTCSLVIAKVNYTEHNGEFTCTAKNHMEKVNGEDIKSVRIEVQVKPVLRDVYRLKSAVAGSNVVKRSNEEVELFCEVERGNPAPKITWYEQRCNGGDSCIMNEASWKQVDVQYPNNSTSTRRSSIITPKADISYWYRCIANNPSGNDRYEFELVRSDFHTYQFAIVSTKTTHQGKKVIDVNGGDEIALKCFVDLKLYKYPSLKKDGLSVPFRTSIEGETIILKYTKSKARVTDTGRYICSAVSRSGDVTHKRILSVNVKECVKSSNQCVFPFSIYEGGLKKTCYGPKCCNLDEDPKGPWCATEVDDLGYLMKYTFCRSTCI